MADKSSYAGLFSTSRIVRLGARMGFVLAAIVFLVGATYRVGQLWLVPEIAIAVPASESGYVTLFSQLSRLADPTVLQIKLSVLGNAADVQSSIESGQTDIAVIRTDLAIPSNGLTIAQLRDDPIAILTFGVSKDASKQKTGPSPTPKRAAHAGDDADDAKLNEKRIGIIDTETTSSAALKRALSALGVPETAIYTLSGEPKDVQLALSEKRIDALVVSARRETLRHLVALLSDLRPSISPLRPAALGFDAPLLSESSLPAHSLANSLPPEDIQTASLSWRLVARRDLERTTVAALLQLLFSRRVELAKSSPLAWLIKGIPDDEATYAKLPNHRGALDYYNREQQTFMDLYGDWLWLGLFAAGGASSALAGLIQLLSRRRRQLTESILDRLLAILGEARQAETVHGLDDLTAEVDGLVTHAIRQARWRTTDAISSTALTLAIDTTRAAIADRRSALLLAQDGTPAMGRQFKSASIS